MQNRLASIEEVEEHLNKLNLDIRVSKNGRWIDQKVTPDILCAIAESIINHRETNPQEPFTAKTLWMDEKLSEIMTVLYSKPDLSNPSAGNEYDKVLSQPLLTLASAKVIRLDKVGSRNYYYLESDLSILRFIAHRDVNALNFLIRYITKVLRDSGIWPSFEDFLIRGSKRNLVSSDYGALKNLFQRFTIENTPINGETEVNRIFSKVINPLAYQYKSLGTKGGFLSKHAITYSELVYNRPNFRDLNKDKNLTRKEAERIEKIQYSFAYSIGKAKRQVKNWHLITEVQDDGSEITNNSEIHHIFMEHERPEIAAHLENLINLTSNQHRYKAHPNSNFKYVEPAYQRICLHKKIDATEKSLLNHDGFYDKFRLLEVVNVGFGEAILNEQASFPEIKSTIDNFYRDRFHLNF